MPYALEHRDPSSSNQLKMLDQLFITITLPMVIIFITIYIHEKIIKAFRIIMQSDCSLAIICIIGAFVALIFIVPLDYVTDIYLGPDLK